MEQSFGATEPSGQYRECGHGIGYGESAPGQYEPAGQMVAFTEPGGQ